MTFLDSIILGFIQGLTEFLPISSTAHLRVIPALLNWDDPGAAFTAVIQWGTVAAVVIYFWKDIWAIAWATLTELATRKFGQSTEGRLGWLIVLGTIPVVIVGLLLKKHIEGAFRDLYVIAFAAIGFALWLMTAEFWVRQRQRAMKPEKELWQLTWRDALVVGLAQVLALIPGASRSGVTITAALFMGMSRSTAARFSFLLSLPSVFGAGVLELYSERHELLASQDQILNLITCTIVSGVVGYASIAWLLYYLKTHSTYLFVIYRLALGAGILLLLGGGYLRPDAGEKKGPDVLPERTARSVRQTEVGTGRLTWYQALYRSYNGEVDALISRKERTEQGLALLKRCADDHAFCAPGWFTGPRRDGHCPAGPRKKTGPAFLSLSPEIPEYNSRSGGLRDDLGCPRRPAGLSDSRGTPSKRGTLLSLHLCRRGFPR
jgi:undecaprenyl-diphosphatase